MSLGIYFQQFSWVSKTRFQLKYINPNRPPIGDQTTQVWPLMQSMEAVGTNFTVSGMTRSSLVQSLFHCSTWLVLAAQC